MTTAGKDRRTTFTIEAFCSSEVTLHMNIEAGIGQIIPEVER